MKSKQIVAAFLGVNLSFLAIVRVNAYAAVNPLNIYENAVVETTEEESEDNFEERDALENINELQWETIEIGTFEQLKDAAIKSTLDTWSRNKYIKLTADIDVSEGEFKLFPTFGGVFDGNGHTINGLNISQDMSYLGLFSQLQPGGTIKNLTVDGSVYPDSRRIVVGGIVGDNYGYIENCVFKGTVKGNDYTGGIAGYNETTGVISNCKSYGNISGLHYTGGVAGINNGTIFSCINQSNVNTSNVDRGMSLEDINLNSLINDFKEIDSEVSENKNLDKSNNTIDTGGIVGFSSGIVEFCANIGNVGYERVGYNAGGIAGRSSGYIHGCNNTGKILGRKDVGGIVGQAEPFIQLDLTEDIVNELTDNINELHTLVNKTLNDSGDSSDVISNRLSLVQKFVDNALSDTSYISGETINFVNGLTAAGNESFGRMEYALKEASKDGGAASKARDAAGNVKDAADNLDKLVKDADIYSYMSDAEKAKYDEAKIRIENNTREYNDYYKKVYTNNYHYYLVTYSNTPDPLKKYHGMGSDLQKKLVPYKADGSEATFPVSINDESESIITNIKHADDTSFPDTSSSEQNEKDSALIEDATSEAANKSTAYADSNYQANHGSKKFEDDIREDAQTMADIISSHEDQMSDATKKDMEAAVNDVRLAADSTESAMSQSMDIANNIASRQGISFPSLSDNYRLHTTSFIANMQGMSDNLGYLNNEMSASTDEMIGDMSEVNDSFNKIMLLFTDAIDGALDGEYVDKFDDESFEVAAQSTEGTIDSCENKGNVSGDLDISGIAGAMGIEFDFDLEGDVTGNKDSKLNSTYKTKCVLRNNRNDGRILAIKSYVGGVVGLQELGCVLGCENYGRISSDSGDYVGGIAGSSISSIKDSYSRGILSGGEYIGGIAGYGHQIYECMALPSIVEAMAFSGAIAGDVDNDSKLRGNYFVSESYAGIDRISYSNLAQPISYHDFIAKPGLPSDFHQVKITFLVDDKVIGERLIDYGASLEAGQYPESIVENDYYIDWDLSVLSDVKTDMEIIGEPIPYRTTIASIQVRDNNQSVVLVDGKFKRGQGLEVAKYSKMDESIPQKAVERWDVNIPNDGLERHQFRIQLPEGVKKASVYVNNQGTYEKAELSEMGMYKLFDTQGSKVSFVIVDETMPKWIVKTIAAVIGLIVLLILIIIISKAVKKSKAKKKHLKNKKENRRENRKAMIQTGIEKAAQLIEEAKDDSPRGSGE